jgi:uncharacterized protein (TIGR03067 family)
MIVLAGLLVAADAPQEAVKKEKEKLKGTWTLVSLEERGKQVPPLDLKFTFEDEKFIHHEGTKNPKEGTYQLDPTKTPRAIDISEAGRVVGYGIYQLDGDTLTLCVARANATRPTAFATADGTPTVLIVFKRAKP